MKKRRLTAGFLTAVLVLAAGLHASAMAEQDIYTDMAFFTATVYVCDSEAQTVVLKNVTPYGMDAVSLEMAAAVEYTETPVTKRFLYNKDGAQIELYQVNEQCLDGKAQIIIGKNSKGYRVLKLEMMP